ncbi:MAG: methyltransferase, partial [Caulobacteraceae bacterium]
ALVVQEVQRAGFKLAGKSDLLRNPADDRTLNVFRPAIRGHTDQFMLRFVKPVG